MNHSLKTLTEVQPQRKLNKEHVYPVTKWERVPHFWFGNFFCAVEKGDQIFVLKQNLRQKKTFFRDALDLEETVVNTLAFNNIFPRKSIQTDLKNIIV